MKSRFRSVSAVVPRWVFLLALVVALVAIASSEAPDTMAQGGGGTRDDRQPAAEPVEVHEPLRGAALVARAQSEGPVRVIVMLNMDYVPEGRLLASETDTIATSQAVARQRDAIRSTRDTLLRDLADYDVSGLRQWESIPGFTVTVDAAALQALQASPLVAQVYEDVPEPMTMGHTIAGIGAGPPGSGAWGEGLDGTGFTAVVMDNGTFANHEFLSGKVVLELCFSSEDPTGASHGGTPTWSLCPGNVAFAQGAGVASPFATDGCMADVLADLGSLIPGACNHGTHVSGTIVGNWGTYNGPGLVNAPRAMGGVGEGADLIAIQVFSYLPGFSSPVQAWISDQVNALDYIYTELASVSATGLGPYYDISSINMSLGGGSYSSVCDDGGARQTALQNLNSVGIAPVVSSGNGGQVAALSRPACYSAAVSVGATDVGVWWDGEPLVIVTDAFPSACNPNYSGPYVASCPDQERVASFSNNASFLDLLAPGDTIESSSIDTTSAVTDQYAGLFGTSMAAPHVTGAWAILKQQRPVATVAAIRDTLRATGVMITDSQYDSNWSGTVRVGASASYPRIQLDEAIYPADLVGANDNYLDYGDAPDSYNTLAASNGARHIWVPEYYLGGAHDTEPDGVPSPSSDTNDDGVSVPSMDVGTTVNLDVTAAVAQGPLAPASPYLGYLNVWIDFNGDGDFADGGEQVVSDQLMTGPYPQAVPLSIPATATVGDTWMRVRYGTEAGLSYDGQAYNGEVEDYLVTITPDTPPIVTSTVPANGATDVLADTTITITFDKAVSLTANAITVECPAGTPVTFSSAPALPASNTSAIVLTPDEWLPYEETCTVTVVATEVSDGDGDLLDGNGDGVEGDDYVFTFTTGLEPRREGAGGPAIRTFDPAISKVGVLSEGGIGLVGEQIGWVITVSNTGSATGADVEVVDTVRSELRIDSVETERGSFTIDGQTVTFTIPWIDPGETVTLRINTTVLTSPLEGQVENTATLSGTSATGEVVTRNASTVVPVTTMLPATGYPPLEDTGTGSSNAARVWLVLVGLSVFIVVTGGWYLRVRRSSR